MAESYDRSFLDALQHFRYARIQADLERVLARLTGKSIDLLSYEDVRQKLGLKNVSGRQELREIPLDAIVGSVGRYTDFTRSFLPLNESDKIRWAQVELHMTEMTGLPPIEVYQIGDVYFVRDGNHRVSVARQLGTTHIEAYVTTVQTAVPLSPDVQPDDLIVKARHASFLKLTHLEQLRPEADLSMTLPGNYRVLEEQIEVHRYMMTQQQQQEIPYHEAVADWYDRVYLPVVGIIRERGMLRDFPDRTEADLYVWITKHREKLKQQSGWQIEPEAAISELIDRHSANPQHFLARIGERILKRIIPDLVDKGPPPGEWRQAWQSTPEQSHLFADILVSINGREAGWQALKQALLLARREKGQLHGIHFVDTPQQAENEVPQEVRREFERRCRLANIPHAFSFETGAVGSTLVDQARWANLLVINVGYALEPSAINRLSANLEVLIRRCPRPILAVSQTASPMDRALLAYDGSAKAKEALFVATYLAGQWQIPLTVVTITEGDQVTSAALERAEVYLQGHGVQATFVQKSGPVAETLLKAAHETQSNLIIMGGYGHNPVVEIVLGSAVDEVLRTSEWPVLICR